MHPAYLRGAQADAEARMLSRANVWRLTGGSVTNADGYKVPEWEVVVADVPCRIASRTGAGQSRTVQTPGGDVQVASRELHVPAHTTGISDGDLIEIAAGEQVETVWQVVEADGADQVTALRLPVRSAERPEEW